MAFGTLKADTLTHSTAGSLTTDYVVNGSAKAWIDYNQVANTTDGSFNVSSVSDDATGRFTYTMVNAMDSANWSMPYAANAFVGMINDVLSSTQGKCRSRDAATSDTDATQNCTCNHGDLA